jgi:hypothetical protein
MTRSFRVMTAMILGALVTVAALMSGGRLLANTLASNAVPEFVNYQGYLTDSSGNPISGTVTLVFRIWDSSAAGTEVWNETHNNVPIQGGYFSVFLGSQGTPLTPSVFGSTSRYLEVTYGATTFPRQRFASVPYALIAHRASEAITSTYATSANSAVNSTYATTATYALNAPSSSGVTWAYVKVVAKSGGDYTSITDALNAITPSSAERYLILVMPGVYEERVTLKEYVHLKGAGIESTFVSFASSDGNFNNDAAATMIVPANAQVSNLTVRNGATTLGAVGLKVKAGNIETILDNVQVEVLGIGGNNHIGLYIGGTALWNNLNVEVNGANANWGVQTNAGSPIVTNSSIRAEGSNPVGYHMNGGDPQISDSTISGLNGATGIGFDITGAPNDVVQIDRSSILGDSGGQSIRNPNGADVFVGASKLQGAAVSNPADITCVHVYSTNYVELVLECN